MKTFKFVMEAIKPSMVSENLAKVKTFTFNVSASTDIEAEDKAFEIAAEKYPKHNLVIISMEQIMKNQINKLTLSWSISKGRDTYRYNICRLDDRNNGKRFRCMGGGYDMIGTVFGDWLETYYQNELMAIKDQSDRFYNDRHYLNDNSEKDTFYGMTYNQVKDYVHLDGACGIESMVRIAEAIGLEIERDYIAKGRRRGETIGWFVQMKDVK